MITADKVQICFNCLSALAALYAAYSWQAASKKPVAKYAGTGYGGVSKDMPINDEIQLGANLNARAATWAAVSAFFQALALLIGIAWR